MAQLDDLVSLTIFARVVDAKSFTRAANMLGLSKSVVSSRVAALERKVGVRLLHRTTRRLSLTPDGVGLYDTCLRLLRVADEAANAVQSVGTALEGAVRLTFPVGLSLHIPKMVHGFLSRFPAIQLELSPTDRHVDLAAEGFDVAIRVTQQVTDNSLVVRRVGVERIVACAAPKYLERHGRPTTPEELREHRCLRSSLHGSNWLLQSDQRPVSVNVGGNLVTDNAAILLQAAIDGIGIALLPMSFVAADIESGRLQRVLANHSIAEMNVFLVHPYQRQVPPKVRVLIDHLVQQLTQAERAITDQEPKKKRARLAK